MKLNHQPLLGMLLLAMLSPFTGFSAVSPQIPGAVKPLIYPMAGPAQGGLQFQKNIDGYITVELEDVYDEDYVYIEWSRVYVNYFTPLAGNVYINFTKLTHFYHWSTLTLTTEMAFDGYGDYGTPSSYVGTFETLYNETPYSEVRDFRIDSIEYY